MSCMKFFSWFPLPLYPEKKIGNFQFYLELNKISQLGLTIFVQQRHQIQVGACQIVDNSP